MRSQDAVFCLYRYQILPLSRAPQPDLFKSEISVDELIARKNTFFAEALKTVDDFKFERTNTTTKKLFEKNEFYLYRIGAERSLNRVNRNFVASTIDTWPSILVAVWNDPTKQYIAVQRQSSAFQQPEAVVRALTSSIATTLAENALSIHWEPLFNKSEFWDIVAANKGKITNVRFDFITPNMANISGSLTESLKQVGKDTNSARNKLELEASNDTALEIDKSNDTISGLVEYASEGAGNIRIKATGVSRSIHTNNTVKEIQISDLEVSGEAESVVSALKQLLP